MTDRLRLEKVFGEETMYALDTTIWSTNRELGVDIKKANLSIFVEGPSNYVNNIDIPSSQIPDFIASYAYCGVIDDGSAEIKGIKGKPIRAFYRDSRLVNVMPL
jgi:5-enolpyruvylshikimate-3-phosphate synthase